MSNADSRAMVTQLWTANFLNIRRATETARSQGRTRLDIGFELLEVTFDFNGNFHKYAIECLAYLSQTSYFAIHVWTLALPEQMAAMIAKLTNSNIYVRGQNENASRKNVAWNTRKPWFDVLLDTTSGFDAGAGHWYWAQVLFQIAAESLSSTRSGATIIRSNDRYAVNAEPHLKSPLGGDRSERIDRGPARP
jgi:hypothetical protein